MLKRAAFLLLVLVLCVFATCGREAVQSDSAYQRHSVFFFDGFDTISVILGYAQSEDDFAMYSDVIRAELLRLHRLFDIFNEYPGMNNLKTINNNAGVQPVEVHPDIVSLILFCIEAYELSGGTVNIALGPVTNIWREYIDRGLPVLPDMDLLQQAGRLTDIRAVEVDTERNTVFLRYHGMSLDVGGIAKGFAVEMAAQRGMAAGFESFTLSVGGDVRVVSTPMSPDRDAWGVGVEIEGGQVISAVFVSDTAVFSSGTHLRYFMADGRRYHHIIDPNTLMPADVFTDIAVIHPDGGMADVLATAAFIQDIDAALEIIARFGAEALWVLPDGSIVTSPGYTALTGN